jgi:C4-dicarboxylate-specific signal transduction histidine kinase
VREQRNELARVSRIATVGELAGALAHELNQPLAAILSNAQAAQRFLRRDEPDTEQVRQIITDIIEDDRRAAAVIHQMRRFLKHEEPELKQIVLNRLIWDTLRALQSDLAIHQVTVESELADDLPLVCGNLVQLQQVVLNLVLNAVDAMQAVDHEGRILTLATELRDDMVCIAVRDRGSGIDQAILRKIFGPFFTTKKDGMGMGLPITRSIVEAHGGQLTVANNEDGGCTFRVILPRAGLNSTPWRS